MTDEELRAIQLHGANAKARGESLSDNPWMKAQNMPLATGDNNLDWEAKMLNWEIGYRTEDLMTRPSPCFPYGGPGLGQRNADDMGYPPGR